MLESLAVALVLGACDSAPGPDSSEGHPPNLSEFSFDPHEVAVDGEGESVEFTLRMEVTATDPDDDLEHVSFVMQAPASGEEPVAAGTLEGAAGGRFEGSVHISLSRGNLGTYTVLVYAVDRRGALSNNVRGMLRVGGSGVPPVTEEVVVPETIERPAQGAEEVTIVAVVSDPDGLPNIHRVEFWNVTDSAQTIEMFDEGENGNETAGDGRYTRVVRVESTNQPGENRFAFQATDLAGLKSNVVEKTIVVE